MTHQIVPVNQEWFQLGDIGLRLLHNNESGEAEITLVPWALRKSLPSKRNVIPADSVEMRGLPTTMRDALLPARKWLEAPVQIKLRGDRGPSGWQGGSTLRGAPEQRDLRLVGHTVRRNDRATFIDLHFERSHLFIATHTLEWRRGEQGIRVHTIIENIGKEPICLEMLSSFCIGGVSPFAIDDASGRLRFHRYRSNWSNEGRPVVDSLEQLSLERSWSGSGVRTERFGNIGSFPVNQWFPHAAVEDHTAGVCWAGQLCHNGSWQMELQRIGDMVSLSGGLADRLFGHWFKFLEPGESFSAPEARLTVVAGDVQDAASRLVAMQELDSLNQPKIERDLPILFNEWCTSWGQPTQKNLEVLADKLRDTGVRFLVIDAGWTAKPVGCSGGGGQAGNGDWEVDRDKFPNGLKAAADAIKKRGLVPGLWFEFEVTTEGAKVFNRSTHQLQLDGHPVDMAGRRFWDFRDPWVIDYLRKKVIEQLKAGGFGYLKVDYNNTIGVGCDRPAAIKSTRQRREHSPGEGLRQHLEAVKEFFKQIRREIPHLVIENCASGGHRLEPSMQALCAMGSFSDAHESVEIPIIAAQLHFQILPKQSQIWCTLRRVDDARRMRYSLAACMLGRMVISGDIGELDDEQWTILREGIAFYRRAVPIIRNGKSRLFRAMGESHRYPCGWQALRRENKNGRRALVIVHRFADPQSSPINIPLNGKNWQVVDEFGETNDAPSIDGGNLCLSHLPAFSARVILLKR